MLDFLIKNSTIKEYKKDSIIFNEYDTCDRIYILIKGHVTIKTATHLEKEETITVLNENDLFGDVLLFSSKPNYLGYAVCDTKATIGYITKRNLLNLLINNPIYLEKYLQQISDKGMEFKFQSKLLAHKNIRDRILYYLNYHKNKYNQTYIPSITKLSLILALPRPSVSRELLKLEKENIISKHKQNNKYIFTILQ